MIAESEASSLNHRNHKGNGILFEALDTLQPHKPHKASYGCQNQCERSVESSRLDHEQQLCPANGREFPVGQLAIIQSNGEAASFTQALFLHRTCKYSFGLHLMPDRLDHKKGGQKQQKEHVPKISDTSLLQTPLSPQPKFLGGFKNQNAQFWSLRLLLKLPWCRLQNLKVDLPFGSLQGRSPKLGCCSEA